METNAILTEDERKCIDYPRFLPEGILHSQRIFRKEVARESLTITLFKQLRLGFKISGRVEG